MTIGGDCRLRSRRRRTALTWVMRSLVVAVGALMATSTFSQQESVVGTLHNLSISGPGEIRAVSETQVCKFCHVPHNAEVPAPLWGHALSSARYDLPELRASGTAQQTPQPDGSSRLCLSCHDGTIALGDIAGEPVPVQMTGASRLHPGNKGFIGTDLTGSHPVSFVVPDGDRIRDMTAESDMGLNSLAAIEADPEVRLDIDGKMQCTTCHDPHADRFYVEGRVPRFWVKSSVDEVCLTCHVPL
ncbi:MAG: cytochrome c3 family protein [Acidobacteriota bacterium]|nr:cytochrome c3 family protein [Acidobacteriota bacterium]